MNEMLLNKDVAKEVLTIILYSDTYVQEKIPEDFMKKLTDLAAESDLEVHIVRNKSLKEQRLSSEALDMFALLYYLYVAEIEEKDQILSQWAINDQQ